MVLAWGSYKIPKQMKQLRLLFTLIFSLAISSAVLAHGVQVRWNIVPSTGAIRVWIEHWHGDAAGSNTYSSFPLVVSYTIAGTTTTQTYYGSGAVDNTHHSNLPNGGNASTYMSGCSGRQNAYNDWVYWDFNPPACNTPVALTIINGPSFYTDEGCSNLYPVTIFSNFNDNSGPVITANDITVAPSTANCGAIVSNYGVSAVDACGGAVNLSYNIQPGTTFNQGTTPVLVTAVDQSGNVSTQSFNVIVADNQAPTVITQNVTVSLQNGSASVSAAQVDGGSFDNACGGIASMSVSPNTFGCNELGANAVTLTVTDIYGNSASQPATVTVTDPVAPSITGPSNIVLTAQPGRCFAELNYSVIASLYSCQILQDLSNSPSAGLPSGSSFPLGTTTNSFTVTDGQGRTASYTFDVKVEQPNPVGVDAGQDQDVCLGSSTNLNATFLNVPAGVSANANSSEELCLHDANNYSGSTNCGNFTNDLCADGYTWFVNNSVNAVSNATGNISDISFDLYYTNCEYSATASINILVNGTQVYTNSPPYTCTCNPAGSGGSYPQSLIITSAQLAGIWSNSGNNTIEVYFGGQFAVAGVKATVNTASSNFEWISGQNIADVNDPTSTVSPTSSSQYIGRYTSPEGCVAYDTVMVNVNPLPTVTMANFQPISFYAAPITLSGGMPAGGVYSGAGISNGQFNPGATSIGLQTINYTYTDANGCTNTTSTTIDVIPCNIQLSNTFSNVSCPGGSDGTIDLSVANANNGASYSWNGPNGFSASTEDLAGLSAGVYTVLVTDGNGCTETASITVSDNPDNTAPNAVAQNFTLILDNTGGGSISAAQINNNSTDACGIASMSVSPSSFSCSDVGSNTVTLTVVDVNGNSSTASAVVEVVDNTAPVFSVQNATVYLDASGTASITVADIEASSSDACGIASRSLSNSSFSCSDLGQQTVSLTVTDVNGNASTLNASVEVKDAIAPAITGMPADIVVVPQPNNCSPSVTWTAPNASDNCSVTLNSTHNPGDNFNVGSTVVTYTAVDPAGNSVSSSFEVTVSPSPITFTYSLSSYNGGDNVSCHGAADGSIDLNPTGGCEPYSYNWSNGASSEDVANLSAGGYSVTISDANGQQVVANMTLTEPTPLTASSASSGYMAGNGVSGTTLYLGYGPQSINLSASATGGHGPYSYQWSNGDMGPSSTVSPAATSTYTVTVTDVNQCTYTSAVTVNVVDVRCAPGKSPSSNGKGNKGNGNGRQYSKVLVCHHGKTICIDSNAVANHLANHNHGKHSCTLGPCNGSAKNAEPLASFDFAVYPNPNEGVFQVQVESPSNQDLRFVITDLQGRVVELRNDFVVEGTTILQFDLARYASGVYFLEIVGAKEKQVARIIKK